MKRFAMAAIVGALALTSIPVASEAGLITRACMKSDRKAASRSLCGCIQNVADRTLTRSDQRMAATFFKDPHKAQEIRQSDRSSHEVFWQKYKAFGATAEAMCRGA